MSASVELPQDHEVVATLVTAGTDLPPRRLSQDRLDRIEAAVINDPTWRRD